jgi:hypothetical protein
MHFKFRNTRIFDLNLLFFSRRGYQRPTGMGNCGKNGDLTWLNSVQGFLPCYLPFIYSTCKFDELKHGDVMHETL